MLILRERANLTKRPLASELLLLIRKLTGYNTPKQLLAGVRGAFSGLIGRLMRILSRLDGHHLASRFPAESFYTLPDTQEF